MVLAHLVNPVNVQSESDLFVAQPITFESMRIAREFSLMSSKDLEIEFLSSHYLEDESVIPEYFYKKVQLKRSFRDIIPSKKVKKLPLLADLFQSFKVLSPEADYYIYSNVDIAVMPHFYLTVAAYISAGYDAIAINRKTISTEYQLPNQLPMMYAQIGKPHEGIDCFVIKKEYIDNFNFEHAIIGSGPVGIIICLNMIRVASKFYWIENGDLTFHLGDDKSWIQETDLELFNYNYDELRKIAKSFRKKLAVGRKQKLFIETIRFCEEVIAEEEMKRKFTTQANPKNVIRKFSGA